MFYESLNIEEAEIVLAALNDILSRPGLTKASGPSTKLRDRLKKALQREQKLREPVTVTLSFVTVSEGSSAFAAMLNPESNEVEVRHNGIPAMSGEWAEVWRDPRDPEDFEVKWSIQRLREYEGREQPDDTTLELLSDALRHALARR